MKKYHFIIIFILLLLWLSVFAGKKFIQVYPSGPVGSEYSGAHIEFDPSVRLWYARKQDKNAWIWPNIPELRKIGVALVSEDKAIKATLEQAKVTDIRYLKKGRLNRFEYKHLSDYIRIPPTQTRFEIVGAISSITVEKFLGKVLSKSKSPWVPLCYFILEDFEKRRSVVNPDVLDVAYHNDDKSLTFESRSGEKTPFQKANLKDKYCGYPK